MNRLSPKYNIALMASAGTGKTYNLALRVVATLMAENRITSTDISGKKNVGEIKAGNFDKILCLTFTRKATAEMADRVHTYLTKLANGQFSSDSPEFIEISNALGIESYELIQNMADKARKKLFTDPSILQIRTIDSFTSYILKLFPFEANISPNFKIITDHTEELIQKQAFKSVFKTLPNNEKYVKLFFEYIKWTKEQPYSFTDRLNKQVAEILKQSIPLREELQKCAQLKPEDILNKLKLAYENDSNIRSAAVKILEYLSKYANIIQRVSNKISVLQEITSGGRIEKLLEKINLFIPDNIKYKKNTNPPSENEYLILYKNLTKLLKEHVKAYEDIDILILLHIAGYVQKEIDKLKRKNNMLSYADLSRLTFNLLNEEALDRQYLYFRLDGRLEHILVDEFQDTSLVQWNILKPLAEEAMSGLAQYDKLGSFFCVGDSKQTIYRFRGSNPNFFQNVIDDFKDRLHEDKLSINYRSDKNIVNFANMLFKDADQYITQDIHCSKKLFNYTLQHAYSEKNGYVSIKKIIGNNAESRTSERLSALENILEEVTAKGWNYEDIAILVSKRDDGLIAYNFLTNEKNIPAQMGFSEYLSSRQAYKIINSLAKYIMYGDIFSLIEFLTISPSLIDAQSLRDSKVINRYKNMLDSYLKKTESMSIYDRIMNIGYRMSLVRRLQNDPDFYILLELIAEHIPTTVNPIEFINSLKSLADDTIAPGQTSRNRISIMTVHGAKGLEFPIVILFDINDEMTINRNTQYFIYENENKIKLHKNINEQYRNAATEDYIEAYNQENLLDRFEKINKLYVAVTRAINILYVLAEMKSEKTIDGYILNHFPDGLELGSIPEKERETQKIIQKETKDKEKFRELCWQIADTIRLYRKKEDCDIISIIKKKFNKLGYNQVTADRFSQYTENAIANKKETDDKERSESFYDRIFGITLHEAIYQMERYDEKSAEKSVKKAFKRYGSYLPEHTEKKILSDILMLINDKDFIKLISNGKIYKEKSIYYHGQIIIIDMYINNNKQISVIDFKTSSPDTQRLKEYEEQLQKYSNALKENYNLPVNAYLIFINNGINIININNTND